MAQIAFVTTGYLREILDPASQRSFTIIVEPLVGRITNVRNFADHYSLIVSGSGQIPLDMVRHAFLHFLLDPLPLQYSHVVAVKLPLFLAAAGAPRLDPDLKDDFPSYFAECTVRAVELKLERMSPGERESTMDIDDAHGCGAAVVCRAYEIRTIQPGMKLYFPDLVRSIDVTTEQKRVAALKFAPGGAKERSDRCRGAGASQGRGAYYYS